MLFLIINNSFQQTRSLNLILSQVEKEHQFGQSLSALVQMSMTVENPQAVQEINDLLQEIKGQMEQRDQREATKCEEKDRSCTVQLSDLREQHGESSEKLKNAEDELKTSRQELRNVQNLLEQESGNLIEAGGDLDEAQNSLVEEQERFEVQDAELNELIIACQEGIKLLKRMVHGEVNFGRQATSFIQISDLKEKIDQANKKFELSTNKKMALMQPVISVLSTLASSTELNYENVMQCINLIQEILDRLLSQRELNQRRYSQTVDDLNTLIENLQDQISTTQSLIQLYTDQINDFSKRISELERVIDDENLILSALDTQIQNLSTECEQSHNQCTSDNQQRDQELATIQRLIEYFEAEVQTTTSNIREST